MLLRFRLRQAYVPAQNTARLEFFDAVSSRLVFVTVLLTKVDTKSTPMMQRRKYKLQNSNLCQIFLELLVVIFLF